MKTPDLDKIRSELPIKAQDFLRSYNQNLPEQFPRASLATLKEFRKAHPGLFKVADVWTLEQHRKKMMDWLPQYLRSLNR